MRTYILTFCIALCGSVSGLFAQTDTTFWFVAPEVIFDHGDRPIVLRITAQSGANVTISQPANLAFVPINITLPPNTTQTVDLTAWIDDIENKPANQVLNKGLKITSSAPVTAYYEVNPTCACNPDIFTLKGKNALGTSFMLPFQNFLNNGVTNAWSSFDIVATENNTQVTIIPSVNMVGHPAGVPFTITLNAGQTYSCVAASQLGPQHPAGSVISSDKPIAVTIKDDSVNGGIYGGCADLMGDQVVPLDIIGDEYIVIKGYLNGADRVFVLATQNNTQVTIDGSNVGTINAGQMYVHVLSANTAYIQTSSPVYVLHITGFGCELGAAVLPPIECTGSQQVGFTRSTSEFFALNIMVQTGGEGNFILNGSTALVTSGNFNAVPGTGGAWQYAQIDLSGPIPVGQASLLVNTSHLYHVGVVHGGSSSGCRYGYFSDYSAYRFLALSNEDTVCPGDPLVLTSNNINGATYQWTGPNGYLSNQQSDTIFNMTPGQAGLYHLTGSVGSCPVVSDSLLVTVPVFPQVTAVQTNAPFCEGGPLTLSATVIPDAMYVWSGPVSIGSDSATATINNTSSAMSGNYSVTTYIGGCPGDTVSLFVEIYDNPVASLFCHPVCEGQPAILTGEASSVGNPYHIVQYGWDLNNDGITDVMTDTAYLASVLPNPGNFPVNLVVTSDVGCTDTVSFTVVVNPKPDAQFQSQNICFGNPYIPVDQSTTSAGTITQHVWFMGDGDVKPGASVQHLYASPGVYQVQLYVQNNFGCADTIVDTVVVSEAPFIDITSTPACFMRVTFAPDSVLNPDEFQFVWDISDGNSSSEQQFDNVFNAPGEYYISLQITDSLGCTRTVYDTVQITETKTLDQIPLPNIITMNNDGINDCLEFDSSFEECNPFRLTVFNRWGMVVYEVSGDPQATFCGKTSAGNDLAPGVYMYLLESENFVVRQTLHIVH